MYCNNMALQLYPIECLPDDGGILFSLTNATEAISVRVVNGCVGGLIVDGVVAIKFIEQR